MKSNKVGDITVQLSGGRWKEETADLLIVPFCFFLLGKKRKPSEINLFVTVSLLLALLVLFFSLIYVAGSIRTTEMMSRHNNKIISQSKNAFVWTTSFFRVDVASILFSSMHKAFHEKREAMALSRLKTRTNFPCKSKKHWGKIGLKADFVY